MNSEIKQIAVTIEQYMEDLKSANQINEMPTVFILLFTAAGIYNYYYTILQNNDVSPQDKIILLKKQLIQLNALPRIIEQIAAITEINPRFSGIQPQLNNLLICVKKLI